MPVPNAHADLPDGYLAALSQLFPHVVFHEQPGDRYDTMAIMGPSAAALTGSMIGYTQRQDSQHPGCTLPRNRAHSIPVSNFELCIHIQI